jgi:hypothetical protein
MPRQFTTVPSQRTVSLARQILIVAILTVATFGVFLIPSWVLRSEATLNGPALGSRGIASFIMALAMLGIERRREPTSDGGVILDGSLVAVIIVITSNLVASGPYTAQLPLRTIATLVGTPLLLLLAHVLTRKLASG